ncbi:MAG: DNA polymerase III subunit delta [Armatimonadetes bacterium]|nr:DNA polymerase III subunit delta [Armatimonadota bacterium]
MARKPDAAAARAYLFRGNDDFQKRQALDELLSSLVASEFADFDLEEIEADTATCDRIIAGLNVPPFGSGRRVVLIQFANKMNPAEQEKLAARLEHVPPTGCLVMVNPAVERSDSKPKRGSEVIGELVRAIRRVGQVREFGGGTSMERSKQAREFAISLFASFGKQITSEAMMLFLQRAGDDFGIIATEVQKLVDYTLDRDKITRSDVEEVTSETPEEKVFKMVDAVATRNASQALRFLREIFDAGDDPRSDAPRVLALLARQFRLIWQARMLAEAGVRVVDKVEVSEDLKSALPSSPNILELSPWQVERARKHANGFSHYDLARCFTAIARADAMLKGVEGNIEDPRMVMELLVVELVGAGR